jgi:uncharacterized protein (DUF305 family)
VHRRQVVRVVAALLAGGLLAGCGAAAGPPVTAAPEAPVVAAPGPHNDTDVMFLQMTLDHHRQGAELVELAATRASRPEVRRLAATMRRQWADESRTMTAWLTAWGAPLAADPDADVHAGHGDLHSLRPSDIEELRRAAGPEVDRTALSLLLGHHHNTVEVARMVTAKGANAEVKKLAEELTTTRQEQVRQMLTLLAS